MREPNTQMSSKLCQKIGYGKIFLHIIIFIFLLLSFNKYVNVLWIIANCKIYYTNLFEFLFVKLGIWLFTVTVGVHAATSFLLLIFIFLVFFLLFSFSNRAWRSRHGSLWCNWWFWPLSHWFSWSWAPWWLPFSDRLPEDIRKIIFVLSPWLKKVFNKHGRWVMHGWEISLLLYESKTFLPIFHLCAE